MTRSLVGSALFFLGGFVAQQAGGAPKAAKPAEAGPRLGNFSVSLNVKDIAKSREFYEKLGFKVILGEQAKNWLILQNDAATIGLFQGGLTRNSLTFNPGWDRSGKPVADFDDVRAIQKTLKGRGVALTTEADAASAGPASLALNDPDGNPILVDQHVPAPKK